MEKFIYFLILNCTLIISCTRSYDSSNNYKNSYSYEGEYNEDGYNEDGYNEDGYNENGYNENGYNEDGYNEDGYNEDEYIRDGTYTATVDYYNPTTGYSAIYTLDVEVEYGAVTVIYFPNDGYLDYDHIYPSQLDEYGFVEIEGEEGKTYRVQIEY